MAHATIPDTLVRPDVLLSHGATLPHCEVIRRLRFLTAPEREVLILRTGLAGPRRTIVQTAAILGRSPHKVHAIESGACAKLRHPSTGGTPAVAPDPRPG
jgi:DNA-directed RNA polymerase sigma subunit (sigma70/sigma32)